MTVLIAEDDDYMHVPLRMYLERRQVTVEIVETPDGLREKAGTADALIVDARMQQSAGAERGVSTVAQLLEQGVVAPTVPVVFISVHQEQHESFLHILSLPALQGRYIWLRKPIETGYLLRVLMEERARRAQLGR